MSKNKKTLRLFLLTMIMLLIYFGMFSVVANATGPGAGDAYTYIKRSEEYIEMKYGQKMYTWYHFMDKQAASDWSMPWGPNGEVIKHKEAYLYEMKDNRKTDSKLIGGLPHDITHGQWVYVQWVPNGGDPNNVDRLLNQNNYWGAAATGWNHLKSGMPGYIGNSYRAYYGKTIGKGAQPYPTKFPASNQKEDGTYDWTGGRKL